MINRKLIEDFFSREIKFEGIERELKIEKIPGKIISIIGPRRAGKTWYFYYLFDKLEKPMYVNCEDIAFRNLSIEEFFEVIKIFSSIHYEPKTILLDEIQVIKEWEILVRSLKDRNFELFITGSSSKLLSKEIATQLRGRSISYLLLPFSFREFLKAKNFEFTPKYERIGFLLKLLKEYLEFGGYPEVVMKDQKERILKEYLEEIFYKDFVERHKIKSIEFGRFLFEFALQNFSKEISLRKIKLFFKQKISFSTLYSYVEKLEDSLNLFFLNKISESVYVRKTWPKKVYICDVGLTRGMRFSEDIGKRMENVVFLELLRKTNEKPLMEIFYFKDYQQREIDFVIKENLRVKELIQVSYSSSLDEIEKRELRALVKGFELFKKDRPKLKIITWDLEDRIEFKNRKIELIPLWKFLIEK